MEGDRKILMSREVVDLIFRGQKRGQRYGLPLSCFSKSGSCYHGVTQTNETRLIDGQLLLASPLETYSESRQDMEYKVGSFHRALCLHSTRNKIWQIVQQAFAGMTGLEKPRVSKCPFCATDYEVYAQNITGGRVRIVLNVVRNYGQRFDTMPADQQMFHRLPFSQINPDGLSQRDLHAVFESVTA